MDWLDGSSRLHAEGHFATRSGYSAVDLLVDGAKPTPTAFDRRGRIASCVAGDLGAAEGAARRLAWCRTRGPALAISGGLPCRPARLGMGRREQSRAGCLFH